MEQFIKPKNCIGYVKRVVVSHDVDKEDFLVKNHNINGFISDIINTLDALEPMDATNHLLCFQSKLAFWDGYTRYSHVIKLMKK